MADPGLLSEGGGNDEHQIDYITKSHGDMFRSGMDNDWDS
jgi:hypothetical protein